MSCRACKCFPTAISNGEDISEIPGSHLFRQISSQRESQKLLQELVPRKLTAYLSVLDLFLTR